jgi:hypothetical protein
MKHTVGVLLFVLPIMTGAVCHQKIPSSTAGKQHANTENAEFMNETLVIRIGKREFTATLLDNATATAFKSMLPLTIDMTELNGNEKYFDLSKSLPTHPSNPGKINSGDLLLYGSKTLVLFYKTFATSYSYTALGKIEEPGGLEQALGTGKAVVTIELKP